MSERGLTFGYGAITASAIDLGIERLAAVLVEVRAVSDRDPTAAP